MLKVGSSPASVPEHIPAPIILLRYNKSAVQQQARLSPAPWLSGSFSRGLHGIVTIETRNKPGKGLPA
jgi:hypothetical protein